MAERAAGDARGDGSDRGVLETDLLRAGERLRTTVGQPRPQAEDAIYDSESMRRFARVELGDEVVPDETTILRFRHLLEQHGLTQAIFDAVTGLLEARRLLLRSGPSLTQPSSRRRVRPKTRPRRAT